MSTVTSPLPKLVGGSLCLDFANTVDPRHSADRDDFLSDYAALVRWSEHASLISAHQGRELVRRARADRRAADSVHRRALALRDAVYHAVTAPALDTRSEATVVINDEVHHAMSMADLTPGDRWVWRWRPGAILDRVLWPVARSAADLLVSDHPGRVRECMAESGCGWLFLDTSKNGRRRWCDMSVCGNRAKARRRRMQRQGDTA